MSQRMRIRQFISRARWFLLACAVGLLLLLIGPGSVAADEAAFDIVEQPVVEVDVNVRFGAEARWLKSMGYDCPGGLCQLTLPAGDEELLARRGIAVRVTARAIRVTGTRNPDQSATALSEKSLTLTNDTDYLIADGSLSGCGAWKESAVTFSTAPAWATVTGASFSAIIAHPRATDVVAYVSISTGVSLTVWNRAASSDPIKIDTGRVTNFNGSTVNRKWSLMARDCVAGQTGTIDRFRVTLYYECPDIATPSGPTPENHGASASICAGLNWADSAGATSYNVYLGTSNPPPFVGSVTSSRYLTASCLVRGTKYYWKIQAANDCETVDGPVWDFTTCDYPAQTIMLAPFDNATGVTVRPWLEWTAATGADLYEVWMNTSGRPLVYVVSSIPTTIQVGPLQCSTRYDWTIKPCNNCGYPFFATQTKSFVTYGTPAAPGSPSPASGATGQPLTTDLAWQQVPEAENYTVYFGTVSPPPLYGQSATNAMNLPPLVENTRYFWKVMAANGCGGGTGPVWDFRTCWSPSAAATPSPTNLATGVQLDADLDWGDVAGATSYDVYFGTGASPTFLGNTASSSYALNSLGCSTHYYWRIVAKNACGSFAGAVWSFWTLTPPAAPSGPTPAQGATNQSINTNLDWDDTPRANSYSVYFGTASPPPVHGTSVSSEYDLPTLAYSTHYYWRVVANNDCGSTASPIWDLTTQPPGCGLPGTPSGPTPADHATGMAITVDLDWADTPGAGSYDVYLGTTTSPPLVGTTTQSSYALANLDPAVQYYWKIVAKNTCGTTAGPLWEFTTVCPPPAAPSMPFPADGATYVDTEDLDWADSSGATEYDVFYGTTDDPPLLATTYTSRLLGWAWQSCSTQYYWKVIARSACGSTSTSPLWSFWSLFAPAPSEGPAPATAATNQSINTDLNWADNPHANAYEVYFGTTDPPPKIGPSNSSQYNLPTLAYSTRYFWKVAAIGWCGTTDSPVWEFSTEPIPVIPPGTPSGPVPSNHSTGVPLNLILDWADSTGAESYDVYLGTEPEPSFSGTALGSSLDLPLIGTTQDSSFALPALSCSTKYYWKVVARNAFGTTAGPVWDMTTCGCGGAVLMLPMVVR